MLKLKSTKQRVYRVGSHHAHSASGEQEYVVILRPWLPGEGERSPNRGELMSVRPSKLVTEDC